MIKTCQRMVLERSPAVSMLTSSSEMRCTLHIVMLLCTSKGGGHCSTQAALSPKWKDEVAHTTSPYVEVIVLLDPLSTELAFTGKHWKRSKTMLSYLQTTESWREDKNCCIRRNNWNPGTEMWISGGRFVLDLFGELKKSRKRDPIGRNWITIPTMMYGQTEGCPPEISHGFICCDFKPD